MNNFIVRTLSAIVYAVLVIGSIVLQPLCFGGHPLLFGVLFMIISTLAVREFHVLSGADVRQQSMAMIANALLFSTLYFLFYGDMVWHSLLLAYVAIMLLALIVQLFRKNDNAIQSWGNLCAGQIMVALPFALMNGVIMHNKFLLLALFILIWANDSGAWFTPEIQPARELKNPSGIRHSDFLVILFASKQLYFSLIAKSGMQNKFCVIF